MVVIKSFSLEQHNAILVAILVLFFKNIKLIIMKFNKDYIICIDYC